MRTTPPYGVLAARGKASCPQEEGPLGFLPGRRFRLMDSPSSPALKREAQSREGRPTRALHTQHAVRTRHLPRTVAPCKLCY